MTSLESTFNITDKAAPGHYGSSQTALLLLDFHSKFVHHAGGPAALTALETAARMRSWAHSQDIQVVHAFIDVNALPFETCKSRDKFAGIVQSMRADGSDKLPAELFGGEDNDIVFTRTPGYVSALKSPGLDEFLQKKGIKSLVLAGLSTSGCVLRTAMAAGDAEYVVTIISDGCADPAEGVHEFTTSKLLTNRGYVVTAAEFQDGFAKATLKRN